MALDAVVGHTDDGLVFLKFEGQQNEYGKPIRTVITLERDMAEQIAQRMIDAAKKASSACKRHIYAGSPIVVPRR